MTSLKTQVPPVNLKERIAALQQKNAAQTQRPTSPPLSTNSSSSSSVPQTNVAALRAKIAKFEKKGGVPVPRGSFGLGGPPDAGQGKSQTSRELYGNRIPAPVKSQTTGNNGSVKPQYTGGSLVQQFTGTSRAPSPFSDGSSDKGSRFSPPSSPLEPLKPIHTGRRGTEFSKAMELARKAEAERQQVYFREGSTSPPPPIIANRRFSSFLDDPPTIIVSPQFDETFDPTFSDEPETISTAEAEASLDSISSAPSSSPPSSSFNLDDVSSAPSSSAPDVTAGSSETVDLPETNGQDDEASLHPESFSSIDRPDDEDGTQMASLAEVSSFSTPAESLAAAIELPAQEVFSASNLPVNDSLKLSSQDIHRTLMAENETEPVPEVRLPMLEQNAEVLNIHSPQDIQLSSPISTSPARDKSPLPEALTDSTVEEESSVVYTMEPETSTDTSFPPTPNRTRDSFLSQQTLEIDIPSSRSSVTESPGHLTLAHRVSPLTSRAILPKPHSRPVPDFTSAPPQRKTAGRSQVDAERAKTVIPSAWSDTLNPEGLEFGTAATRDQNKHPRTFSSSYAEPDFNPSFDRNKSSSFNAVVHGKTRDVPAVYSATLPRANPVTPIRHGIRPPALEEPMSPGFGDLALLMEQSAQLEERLLNGEFPDEVDRKGALCLHQLARILRWK
ncbi:hypothetical protein BDP27DRAFT_53584 [Rhodocollybia butyracea]|uniref:Uncharacterized protein n=1 Tax=Rhodocollybia butyracea TaxID=206335 RepID=A0A9P5U4A1_9AGAR|nr:hypothetical protein BDP27DRAFT_53584 [Rhodocollybia butyracea]